MQVADSVFDRSPLELKHAFAAAKKRRETESVLMTRAYREKLANKQPNKVYTYAVIRVRFPEGLLLQVCISMLTRFEAFGRSHVRQCCSVFLQCCCLDAICQEQTLRLLLTALCASNRACKLLLPRLQAFAFIVTIA